MHWALPLFFLAAGDFRTVDTIDGTVVEGRFPEGSNFEELRVSARTSVAAQPLCRGLFAEVTDAKPFNEDVASRQVLSRTANEVVFYDRVKAPLISERDYAYKMRWVSGDDQGCVLAWAETPELAPKLPDGVVRMPKLSGTWTVTTSGPGTTQVTYQTYSDLGGSVPAWIARSGTRKAAVRDLKRVVASAQKRASQLPAAPAVVDGGEPER